LLTEKGELERLEISLDASGIKNKLVSVRFYFVIRGGQANGNSQSFSLPTNITPKALGDLAKLMFRLVKKELEKI